MQNWSPGCAAICAVSAKVEKATETATKEVNSELKKLAYANDDYDVKLNASGIEVADFINKLQLGAISGGANVMLGGDGRNNQILIALWKALSVFEHDTNDEVVFFFIY